MVEATPAPQRAAMSAATARLLRIGAIAAVVLVAALVSAYSAIFGVVKDEVGLMASFYLGMDAQIADVAGWVFGLVAAAICLPLALRLALGTLPALQSVVLLLAAAALLGAIGWLRSDWMFGPDGRHVRFLCPPVAAGELPRVNVNAQDRVTGMPCVPVTPGSARTVLAMRKGSVPERVRVGSVADLDALQLFDPRNGMPLVFLGESENGGDMPALYRNAGFDPHGPALLRELTADGRRSLRRQMDAAEKHSQAELNAKLRQAADEERRLRDRQRAVSLAAQRRALAALLGGEGMRPSPDALGAPLFQRELPDRAERQIEAHLDLGVAQRDWQSYFWRDPAADGGRRVRSYLLARSAQVGLDRGVLSDLTLDGTPVPLAALAKPMLFAEIDWVGVLKHGKPDSLRHIAFPPGIEAVTVIDLLDACATCSPRWVLVRWLEIDVESRRVLVRSERKMF